MPLIILVKSIKHGVPQGSIMETLVFHIYVKSPSSCLSTYFSRSSQFATDKSFIIQESNISSAGQIATKLAERMKQ